MSWNNISKPATRAYTNVNPAGKVAFDDVGFTFNDPNVFFDGTSNTWTNIPKPFRSGSLNRGMTMGLLIPLTESRDTPTGDSWTKVKKPNV